MHAHAPGQPARLRDGVLCRGQLAQLAVPHGGDGLERLAVLDAAGPQARRHGVAQAARRALVVAQLAARVRARRQAGGGGGHGKNAYAPFAFALARAARYAIARADANARALRSDALEAAGARVAKDHRISALHARRTAHVARIGSQVMRRRCRGGLLARGGTWRRGGGTRRRAERQRQGGRRSARRTASGCAALAAAANRVGGGLVTRGGVGARIARGVRRTGGECGGRRRSGRRRRGRERDRCWRLAHDNNIARRRQGRGGRLLIDVHENERGGARARTCVFVCSPWRPPPPPRSLY